MILVVLVTKPLGCHDQPNQKSWQEQLSPKRVIIDVAEVWVDLVGPPQLLGRLLGSVEHVEHVERVEHGIILTYWNYWIILDHSSLKKNDFDTGI